LRPSF